MRHTKLAGLMGPAEKIARVAADAQSVARRALTRRSGTVVVPNGDGTSTVIGPGAGDTDGQSNGVAQWVGDTTPPGRPIGMAASSAWGVLYVTWGGELEGGMPPDFAYCAVMVDGVEKARMAERGTVAIEGLEPGAVAVTLVAYDAARDMDGNLAPNASQPSDAVAVEAVDERAEIDEAVQEAKDAADAMAGQITEVTTKVEGLEGELDHVSTQVTGAVEDADAALTAATEAKQDIDGFKTTVSQTYETKADADAAIAQERLDRESAIEQSATEIMAQVSEGYVDKTTGATYATKTEVQQSADSILSEVSTTYQSKDGMSSYATKSYVDQQDGSITSTVEEVQQTANGAMTKATEVEQTAEGLQVTLTQTTNTANAAQSAANAAQSTANSAQQAASDAAKTATNFLRLDSSGLCVGDQTAGTLGANALIAPNAYSLRKGSTVLSRFSENAVDLGMNSKNSSIEMCGGSATIMSDSSGNVTIKAVGRGEDAGNSNSLNLYGGGCRVSLLPNMIGTGGANGIDIDANFLDFGGSNRGFSTSYGSHYISTSDAFDVLYEALNPTSVSLTPNQNLANYNSYTNSSVRFGNLLILQCSIALSTGTNWSASELTLFTLPAGSRPSAERTLQRSCLVITANGANVFVRTVKVRTDGVVRFVNDGSTSNVSRVMLPGVVVRM